MELVKNEVNGLENVCELFVRKEELDARIAEELNIIQPQVKMPGFRPGHVPLSVVAKNYGYLAKRDAVNKIVDSAVATAIEGKDVVSAFKPDASIISDDENGLKISVKFEEMPAIELKDLSNLTINKYRIKIVDRDIDEYLDEMLTKDVKWVEAEKNYKAAVGDNVDVELTVKSKALKKKKVDIEKNLMSFVVSEDGDVEKHLNGLSVGDEKDFEIDVEDGAMKVHVKVLKISVAKKYELDDEFISHAGFKTMEELRDWARTNVEHAVQVDVANVEKKQLLDYLNSVYSFDVPRKMLDFELNSILRQIQLEADREGKKLSKTKMPKVEEECKDIALRRVRLGLVISKIAKEEKISVSSDELKYAMWNFASMFPGQENSVIAKYSNDPAFVSSLAGPILERKVVEFIERKYAKINEVEITTKELDELDSEFFDCYEDEDQQTKTNKGDSASSGKKTVAKKAKKETSEKAETPKKVSSAAKPAAKKKSPGKDKESKE